MHKSLLLLLAVSACGTEAPPAPPDQAPPADLAVEAPEATPSAPPEAPAGTPPSAAPSDPTASAAPSAVPPAPPSTVPPSTVPPSIAPPSAVVTPPTPPPATTPGIPASAQPSEVPPAASNAPLAPPSVPAPAAVQYKLDPSKGAIYVQVFKDPNTIAAGLSHDHVIVATGWSGTVTWNVADPGTCKVSITVPVSGLQNDAESWRKKVGYDTVLSDSQRADVRTNMMAADQLDAAQYKEMRFVSTGCSADGDRVKVAGTMTIHGQERPTTISMRISADGSSFSASGSFSAKQTDFGIQPFSAMGGALKNKDALKFSIDVRGSAG